MTQIKKIGVLSMAKFNAILFAILGLVGGIFIATFGSLLKIAASQTTQYIPFVGLGFLAIIILPIMYCIMGFVGGAIGAGVYNLVAGWIGGIEVDFGQ